MGLFKRKKVQPPPPPQKGPIPYSQTKWATEARKSRGLGGGPRGGWGVAHGRPAVPSGPIQGTPNRVLGRQWNQAEFQNAWGQHMGDVRYHETMMRPTTPGSYGYREDFGRRERAGMMTPAEREAEGNR